MNRTATRPRAGVAARILLAALLVLGMLAPAAGAPRLAWAAETGSLTVGGKIYYDAYNTNWFEVDGQMAWCGNPSMATPGSGTYAKQPLSAGSSRRTSGSPTGPPGSTPRSGPTGGTTAAR